MLRLPNVNPRPSPDARLEALLASFDLARAEALAHQVREAAPGEWRYGGDGGIAFMDGVLLLLEGRPITAAELQGLSGRDHHYGSAHSRRGSAAHNRWHVLNGKGYMKGGRLMWTGG
jgi:hypothetical protein